MKIFKILITLMLLLCTGLSVQAKKITIDADKIEFMNLDWWKQFEDKNLDNYMLYAYKNNRDLKIATASTKQAQQVVKLSFSDQLPQLTFNPQIGREFTSSNVYFGDVLIPDYKQSRFLLPLTMTYEADIWGENYMRTKSVKQRLKMIEQDERSSYILITTSLASNYFNLIKADKLIENQKKLVDLQQEVVNLYQKKYDGGLCSINEVLSQKQWLTVFTEELNTS